MLSVENKLFVLNVIMLRVVVLNVVAPSADTRRINRLFFV